MDRAISHSSFELTRLSAGELAREISAGHLSARDAVEALIRRIEEVNPRINAVVVKRFDEARAEAAAADETQAGGASLGPLHGVPITVKECFHLSGTPSTIGVGRFQTERIADDSPLVSRLRRAGAIVLGKTNVSQLMLLHESDNPVYGRTNNPWNLQRSAGGSTGGEAAIISAGGSPLGLGNDMGGSIRQPAHSCGIHGLMPTLGRLTNAGSRRTLRGMEAIGVQAGPMARSVADLTLALRVLTAESPSSGEKLRWNSTRGECPAPLNEPARVDIRTLRIGLCTDDGFFAPAPTIQRAVRMAAAALNSAGAQIVPLELPEVPLAVRIYFGLISADGGAGFMRLLGNSRRDPQIKQLMRLGRFPRWMGRGLASALEAADQVRLGELVRWTGPLRVQDYWELCAQRVEFAERFMSVLDGRRLDALVLPPHALPALRHGMSATLPAAASYCYLANLLGLPAGVVAATTVRAGEETERPASRDRVEKAALAVEQGSTGLPVGVQIIGRCWREDIVLAVMGSLETSFRGEPNYPISSHL